MKHLNPKDWPRPSGYSNGIEAEGKFIFVAGMVGWDVEGNFPAGFAAQFEQALENTVAVLRAGDAGPEHIVRMTWFIKDLEVYRQNVSAVGQIYRKVIGKNFPTMTVVGVNDLVEREAVLEIETTAVV